VVAEQGKSAIGPGEIEDLETVGTAVDQITKEDELVVLGESEALKQVGELLVAAMDVADGDDTSVHFSERKLASVGADDK
jgi:hypothetical protein